MSNDLNRCEFIGRVGSIETRYTADGKAITNLSLACNESWKSKIGEKQESTEWVRVCIFGKLAEIAKDYVQKGNQIYISGKLKTRKWQDKQGQDRYTTEIVVDGFNGVMQMLGGKGDNNQAKAQQRKPFDHTTAEYDNNDFDTGFDDDLPPF
jgi:single-strand DNA-binding protein